MAMTHLITALTVAELFISMPDSILPYMSQQQRKEIVELKQIETDSIATYSTSLGDVKLTRMTDDILKLQVSEYNSLEIGLISADTIMFIKTYGAPSQESTCYTYTTEWNLINTSVNKFTRIYFGDTAKDILREEISPIVLKEDE